MKTITVNGPDGSGKTTLIDDLVDFYNHQGKRVVVKRSRPIGFPIASTILYGKSAEIKASQQLHYNKKNKNKFISLIVFLYYVTDYLLGHIYIKFNSKYDILIFDRYYFDYVCNMDRFSLNVNASIVNFILKIIYVPEKNIYLLNTPSEILKKRQELSHDQIVNINDNFVHLFDSYSKNKNFSKSFKIIKALNKNTLSEAINFVSS